MGSCPPCSKPAPRIHISQTLIRNVNAKMIFDTRLNQTIEVDVWMLAGYAISASVPSGAPPGSNLWEPVREAIDFVNSVISPALSGKDPREQAAIDDIMVRKLEEIREERGSGALMFGATAIFAVSLAVCRVGSFAQALNPYSWIAKLAGNKKLVMPIPVFNVFNFGLDPENKLSMRELTILPVGVSSFKDARKINWEIYYRVMHLVRRTYGRNEPEGEEGGFAPKIKNVKEALELLTTAISQCGHTGKVAIGVAAASEFYGPDKTYIPNFSGENNGCLQQLSKGALKDFYKSLVTDNHVVSIEEAFDKDDWESYSKLTAEIGKEVQILGDEFLVTDPKRIERAIKEKTCNTLLLKLKHLRTVTETIHVVKRVKEAGWGVAVSSHGSGETDDTFVAHLAVGLGACQIKVGASCKFERHSIYREVEDVEGFEIEDFGAVDYAGAAFNIG
ncbi:hypothetical protein UlMin_011176 [Ulmus minor]